MTIERRLEIANEIFLECLDTLARKGNSYAGNKDTLANFKRNAERLGLTPFQVLSVYWNKHVDSINNAIQQSPDYPVDTTEGLRGRVIDNINYSLLLLCLLEDQEHIINLDTIKRTKDNA